VPSPEITSYRDPLDLLRRFAPTPLKTHLHLGFANVLLETNDLSFVPSASHFQSSIGSTSSPGSQPCLWKIVRDLDVRQQLTEASIVMAGSLIVYAMGPACMIAADRERKEVLAFIGFEVDARCFQEAILPALCRLTEFVMRHETPRHVRVAQIAIGDPCNA
jgi:hypothetical protein